MHPPHLPSPAGAMDAVAVFTGANRDPPRDFIIMRNYRPSNPTHLGPDQNPGSSPVGNLLLCNALIQPAFFCFVKFWAFRPLWPFHALLSFTVVLLQSSGIMLPIIFQRA